MADEKDGKGEEFVKQAERRLRSWSIFNSSKFEDAIELYTKAAAQFKITKDWDQAAKAYMQAAEISERIKQTHDACTNYIEAAKCYKNGSSLTDAVRVYRLAITLHMDGNRFSTAAKLWKEVAQIEEKKGDNKAAIDAWNECANCYEASDGQASANQALLKVAELAAAEEDYKRAITIYEKVARTAIESQLGRHSVKDYLFKAALCHFALEARAGDVKALGETLEKYKDQFPMFDGSRECKLIENCFAAFTEDNVEKFTEHLVKFNSISPLDGWSSKILLDIKTALKEGPSGDADGPDLT